jgi:hypothetical protein
LSHTHAMHQKFARFEAQSRTRTLVADDGSQTNNQIATASCCGFAHVSSVQRSDLEAHRLLQAGYYTMSVWHGVRGVVLKLFLAVSCSRLVWFHDLRMYRNSRATTPIETTQAANNPVSTTLRWSLAYSTVAPLESAFHITIQRIVIKIGNHVAVANACQKVIFVRRVTVSLTPFSSASSIESVSFDFASLEISVRVLSGNSSERRSGCIA